MARLSQNWITEDLIDFEYKKYLLLAYFKEVNAHFNEYKVYPFLSDMLNHYNNLIAIKKNKSATEENFPKLLTKADFESLELAYEKIIQDEDYIEEIENIINYALPLFTENLNEGKELYDFIEDKMIINPIGIIPIYMDEGYLLIKENHQKDTWVYEYNSSLFENANETYRSIKMEFIDRYSISLNLTFESIKLDLVKRLKKYANPATYLIETEINFPFEESVLPIAKRLLLQQISRAA